MYFTEGLMHYYSYSILLVVAAVAVVYLIMFFHMLKFRKSSQDNFHKSVLVELIWFLVPIVILIVLLLPIMPQLS